MNKSFFIRLTQLVILIMTVGTLSAKTADMGFKIGHIAAAELTTDQVEIINREKSPYPNNYARPCYVAVVVKMAPRRSLSSLDYSLTLNNITELTFDNAFLATSLAGFDNDAMLKPSIFFKNLTLTEIIEYFGDIRNGTLYTLQLTVTGASAKNTTTTKEYKSLLNLTGYSNNSNVQSVTLDNSEIVF